MWTPDKHGQLIGPFGSSLSFLRRRWQRKHGGVWCQFHSLARYSPFPPEWRWKPPSETRFILDNQGLSAALRRGSSVWIEVEQCDLPGARSL